MHPLSDRLRASHPRTQLPNLTPTAWPPRPIAPHLYRPRVSWSHRRASAELPYQPHFTPPTTPLYLTTTKPPNNNIHKQPNALSNQAKMQSTTVLVNAHSSCPKCGATIEGDNKSCGSCGSVSFNSPFDSEEQVVRESRTSADLEASLALFKPLARRARQGLGI